LSGETKGIVSDNAEHVSSVSAWVNESEVGRAIKEMKIIEKEIASLKRRLTKQKKSSQRLWANKLTGELMIWTTLPGHVFLSFWILGAFGNHDFRELALVLLAWMFYGALTLIIASMEKNRASTKRLNELLESAIQENNE
jgi:hypothetical protein